MYEHCYEKIINDKIIIYDKQKDIIKFNYDEKILDNYSNGRLAQVASYKLDIAITEKCNQDCVYCFANCVPYNLAQEISYARLVKLIEERMDEKIRLVITGGEPFMHSAIDEILQLPRLFKNLYFVICSNGTLINESHIILLKELNWLIILSIHGDLTTHNTYTRSNSYSKVIQALERLSAPTAARVKIYSVINEYSTKEDIDHIFHLQEKYRISAIKFMTPRSTDGSDIKYNEKIVRYIKNCYGQKAELQKISSKTELITAKGNVRLTD